MRLNPLIKIKHPKADQISIQDTQYHHAVPGFSSEIALFLNGEFVVEPIEPFADYHDGSTSDSATYGWVPNQLVEAFLDENRCE